MNNVVIRDNMGEAIVDQGEPQCIKVNEEVEVVKEEDKDRAGIMNERALGV